ncbi:hypothetical protein [Paraburkholderia strydomiana]|uniref:hypothetical protein n=1 Tax=Paraburkholderia strydomiana TaxID=1245417 RepID=UPI0038BA5B8B
MDNQTIIQLASEIAGRLPAFSWSTLVIQAALMLTAGLAGGILGGYLSEKGKNLATRQDIGQLTRLVEDIKNEHIREIEMLKSTHQLRVAAIDRRLQAHQEAFALWRDLMQSLETENAVKTVVKCDRWWSDNCLYLEAAAREAFSNAYWSAQIYGQVKRRGSFSDRDSRVLTDRLQIMAEAGNTIIKAVELPGLSEAERQRATESVASV